ncbi:hypothetical protein KAX06_03320 [candidate division WOR-3 bacterium]|nr:hypothetical protein [candidate division WOR-3 bacterium]
MWFFNKWLILISLAVVISTTLINVIWSLHSFPYCIYAKSGGKAVESTSKYIETRKVNLIEIFKKFPLYSRETGYKVGDAFLWNGIKKSMPIYLGAIIGVYIILIAISLILPPTRKYAPLIYTSVLIIITIFIFPELFVRYSKLPGGLASFPFDIPGTPLYWGGLVSLFGSILILKKLGTYQIFNMSSYFVKIKLIIGVKSLAQVPFPAFWILVAIMVPMIWNAPFATWTSFLASWVLGLITTSIFAMLM